MIVVFPDHTLLLFHPLNINMILHGNKNWNTEENMVLFRAVHRYICSAQSENLDNSGIALRKVRIPKLADRVRILTLRGTIPELSVRKVRIGTK